jgi:hypothetical protein
MPATGRIQITQTEGSDIALQGRLGKPQQEAAGIAVAGDRAGAQVLLQHVTGN